MWCEHFPAPGEPKKYGPWAISKLLTQVDGDWKFCPICGAPRPRLSELDKRYWDCSHPENDPPFHKYVCDPDWSHCPQCGKPRPLSKSLMEVLVEKFKLEHFASLRIELEGSVANRLADIAISTIKQFESKEGVK